MRCTVSRVSRGGLSAAANAAASGKEEVQSRRITNMYFIKNTSLSRWIGEGDEGPDWRYCSRCHLGRNEQQLREKYRKNHRTTTSLVGAQSDLWSNGGSPRVPLRSGLSSHAGHFVSGDLSASQEAPNKRRRILICKFSDFGQDRGDDLTFLLSCEQLGPQHDHTGLVLDDRLQLMLSIANVFVFGDCDVAFLPA